MDDPASISCAENIALLHLLHARRGKDGSLPKESVPVPPSVDNSPPSSNNPEYYALSFKRERSLASALAFISRTEDDPNHIPAVCIEEDHRQRDKPSLRVLLAVNRSKWEDSDGDKLLKKIKDGFEDIFDELSKVVDDADDDQQSIERGLRRLIVSMCSEKILDRLRLTTSGRRASRQDPNLRFQKVITTLKAHATTKSSKLATVSEKEEAMFIERSKEILALIDMYTNHPRPQQLENLVYGFYRLRHEKCEAILNTIPNDIIPENNIKCTLDMIRKVARYAESARFLFRTCKKFPIARRMHVEVVCLPKGAFTRAPVDLEYSVVVSSLLSRVGAPQRNKRKKQENWEDDFYNLVGAAPSKADNDVTKQVLETRKNGKVHAEVQLVLYCEIHKKFKPSRNKLLLPPRVVCSSKKACFLCNLFIKMHGKMQTPWSHGKLYPRWLLPDLPGLNLQLRFNDLLAGRIRDSTTLLFQRRQKTDYQVPNLYESTLVTLSSLASELESAAPTTDSENTQMRELQAKRGESVGPHDSNKATFDNEGLEESPGRRSSVVDLASITGDTPGDANNRTKSDPASHTAFSNPSSRTGKMTEGGNQEIKRCIQEQPSSEDFGKAEELTQSDPSSNGPDHFHGVQNDDPVSANDGHPEVCKDSINPTDLEEQSSHPHKPRHDGPNFVGQYYHLRKRQRISHEILPNHVATFFTKSFVIEVEYSTESSLKKGAAGKPTQNLPISIDRLGGDEIARLKDNGTMSTVNADAMHEDDPLTPPSMDGFYVAARGEVFKITFQ